MPACMPACEANILAPNEVEAGHVSSGCMLLDRCCQGSRHSNRHSALRHKYALGTEGCVGVEICD